MGLSKTKKLKSLIIILCAILGSIIIALSTLLIVFVSKSNTYKLQLENNYKRNFYELISDINALEIDLSKLIATNSLQSQKTLLTNIYDTSKTGTVNLSTLPIASNKIENLNKYLNTIGGYSYSLLEKNLNNNEKINDNELKKIEEIYDYCVRVKYDLNNYITDIENFNIINSLNYSNGDLSQFNAGIETTEDEKGNIPTLIYDGPFSDSVINREIRGLDDTIYTEQQIREILKNNFRFFDDFEIEYVGETLGKFATFNYRAFNDDVELYVQVTKQGAFVLGANVISSVTGNNDLSIQKCELFAHNFASLMGIDNMFTVWSQKVAGIVYVNLAPIVNGVIYYPDLIKVKINARTGFVEGWEASNYAYNHTNRESFSYGISFDEAQSKLSSALKIIERNYAVIPNEFVGESFAYEFICEWNDFTYYIYLDCYTGEEINIMRVVNTTNGNLLM